MSVVPSHPDSAVSSKPRPAAQWQVFSADLRVRRSPFRRQEKVICAFVTRRDQLSKIRFLWSRVTPIPPFRANLAPLHNGKCFGPIGAFAAPHSGVKKM